MNQSSPLIQNLGIQLFSLPKLLESDVRSSIQMLGEMGYTELELYGPYPFSAETNKNNWAALTPMLGFSGSGYFGHPVSEFQSILEDYNMKIPSIHTDLDTLQDHMGKLGEAGDMLGFTYVGLPAIPDDKRVTLDDYKRIADDFNKIGEEAQKNELKFAYHNHGYGLQELDGEIPLNVILDRTQADLVFFEMDIYWTSAGRANPIDYLNAYPGRYHLMHLKDMKEKVHFSGDGGDASQWIALFPFMASAGDGVLDLSGIIAAARQSGVKHFLVEQDMVDQPEIALNRSAQFLTSL
ncbi:MAG: sugar phosphate isomerase/epimerase [Bacteroidota bacterium]